MQAVHRDNYPPNQNAIDIAAALPLYGKPLFGALYVSLLFEKLRVVLDAGEQHFASVERSGLARTGLAALRGLLCTRFDALAVADRWRTLANEVPAFIARLLELYRNQHLPATAEGYVQIHPLHPNGMAADPNLTGLNFHWFCLAFAALLAAAVGGWQLHASSAVDGSDGQLRVESPSSETSLFFLNQDTTARTKLEDGGLIATGSGRRVLLIYPAGHERPKRLRRNPGRLLPGSHTPVEPREVWFQDCALESLNTADLVNLIKREISAAHPL